MKKVKVICMALLAVIAMASCRGPRGPEGPAGPAGQDGNANVVSSTVTVYPNDWYFDNNTSWRVDIEYKAIDADIHDYGAVLVYMNQENTWRQLPFTFYYSQNLQDGSVGYFSSSLEVSTYEEGVSIFCGVSPTTAIWFLFVDANTTQEDWFSIEQYLLSFCLDGAESDAVTYKVAYHRAVCCFSVQ